MRYFLFFTIQIMMIYQAAGQNISSILAEFSQDSLIKTVRELSGEDSVMVNGSKTIIISRAAYLGRNTTEDYLKARLAGYNLIVQTQKYSINGLNVSGIQQGAKYPDRFFIIGAHHDAATAYCADDNASGCAAVMEAARILSKKCLEYSVIYMFWDEEEAGLWGSSYHARKAQAEGQTFQGIINMDMLGYDGNNDRKIDIHVNSDPSSLCLADSVKNIIKRYNLNLDPQIINPGTDQSDQYSYWKQGFLNAISYGERVFTDDPNPAYHTENDRIGIFNIPYFAELSKMTLGLMASLANPCASANSETASDVSLSEVVVFPNPTTGKLTIDIKNNPDAKMTISDISGRILKEINFSQTVNTINLNYLPDGIYIMSLTDNYEMITRKIVKTH